MIINQIDIIGVASFKTEGDTPVGADSDGPEACQAAPKRVKPKAGQVHMADLGGFIETGENALYLVNLIGLEMAALASLIEPS
jgi:hypothetical protein